MNDTRKKEDVVDERVVDGRDKFLYRITNKLGEFYVVAHDWNEAEKKLVESMNAAEYGFVRNREVQNISAVAVQRFRNCKISFSEQLTALIVD